jgi:hypothetical protein
MTDERVRPQTSREVPEYEAHPIYPHVVRGLIYRHLEDERYYRVGRLGPIALAGADDTSDLKPGSDPRSGCTACEDGTAHSEARHRELVTRAREHDEDEPWSEDAPRQVLYTRYFDDYSQLPRRG